MKKTPMQTATRLAAAKKAGYGMDAKKPKAKPTAAKPASRTAPAKKKPSPMTGMKGKKYAEKMM